MTISNISSKAIGSVVTKLHVEPSEADGQKICSNRPAHMINMATMPIYRKNFKNLRLQNEWIDGLKT